MSTNSSLSAKPALWFWIATALGLAWSLFGLVQFVGSLKATPESLIASGLTADQARVMLGYPSWMTVAFAVGVLGGVAGTILLGLRNARANMVLAVSLAGYVILWIGDAVHGVFAALGTPQIVILSLVVLIAAGLLAMARHAAAKGWLR
jgi:hypothetical protein